MPMIPFIGVRISWLMLARKSDLRRDASVALSWASDMAISAHTSAVTSARVPTHPDTPPNTFGMALDVTSTVLVTPSDNSISNRWLSSASEQPFWAAVSTPLGGCSVPMMLVQTRPAASCAVTPVIVVHRGLV